MTSETPKITHVTDVVGEPQVGTMMVSSHILNVVSSGIYSNPENAFKELISNSYDADASQVTIRAKPEFDTITLTDDGIGMDYSDFDRHFSLIARSDKRDFSELTPFHRRPLIGKIGIGFIAVSQLCDKMTVISAKRGSALKMEAKINFGAFRRKDVRNKPLYEVGRYTLTNQHKANPDEHYSVVVLTELVKEFKAQLEDKNVHPEHLLLFDGLSFEEIMDQIEQEGVEGLSKGIGGYWQFMLNLANIVPVPYLRDGPIKLEIADSKGGALIREMKEEVQKLKFRVDFDGVILKKPIRLPSLADIKSKGITEEGRDFDVYPFHEKSEFEDGTNLSLKGYFYSQRARINLIEQRGVIIRIRNTAIGGPDPDFLGYPYSSKLFLPMIFGEIVIDEGLEDAMNVDRASFKNVHPHYGSLRNFIHRFMHDTVVRDAKARWKRNRDTSIEQKESAQRLKWEQILTENFHRQFRVVSSYTKGDKAINIMPERGELRINYLNPTFFGKKKLARTLLADVLIAFEIARRKANGDIDKFSEVFQEILKGLIS